MLKDIVKRYRGLLHIVAYTYNVLHRNNSWKYSIGSNKILIRGVFLNGVKFKIKGTNNKIIIGEKARLNNCEVILLGNNCTLEIGGGCTIVSNTQFWLQDDNSAIFIGNDFTIESGHIASTEGQKIVIGNDCMFANDIEIRNGDSHSIIDVNTKQRVNPAQSVYIGNHVWLTAHTRILKGSQIAHSCIIGNSSVVSGKLEVANAIYGGMPARLLKENRTWNRYKL